jgi:transposase
LNAILYAAENGCKWRAPPSESRNWRIVYTRFNRWSKNGTLELVFEGLQRENIVEIKTISDFGTV